MQSNNTTNATCPNSTQVNSDLVIGVQAVLFTMAVVGNGLVVAVLLSSKKKLTRVNFFILHLAVADIFVALFSTMIQLVLDLNNQKFLIGNDGLCRLTKFLQMFPVYASTYIMVMCTVDRFFAIVYPLTSRIFGQNIVQILVLIAWLIGACIASPQLFIFYYDEESRECRENMSLWDQSCYLHAVFILVFVIPLIILIVCYGTICFVVCRGLKFRNAHSHSVSKSDANCSKGRNANREYSMKIPSKRRSEKSSVRKRLSRMSRNTPEPDIINDPAPETSTCRQDGVNRQHRKSVRSNMKTIRITVIVCVLYVVCWAPFFLANIWWVHHPEIDECQFGLAIYLGVVLTILNSCCNPWVYGFYSLSDFFKRRYNPNRGRDLCSTNSRANSNWRQPSTNTGVMRCNSLMSEAPTSCRLTRLSSVMAPHSELVPLQEIDKNTTHNLEPFAKIL